MKSTSQTISSASHAGTRWLYALMAIVIVFVVLARVRLLDLPLERDEGEYAYAGQLLLQGVPPYAEAYNMKLPGTYVAYAAGMAVFGETETGIRLSLLLVNLLTAWLVFLIGRKLCDANAGIISCAAFVVISASPAVHGLWAHATHFLTLAAMAGTLALIHALETNRARDWFLAGLGFGTAFVMKQHGVFFVMFGMGVAMWKLWQERRLVKGWQGGKGMVVLAAGAALPFVVVVIVALASGVFAKFWFWTFTYASQYASRLTLAQGLQNLWGGMKHIAASVPLPMLLSLAGLWLLTTSKSFSKVRGFVVALLIASFLVVCPGLYFREHYFIPLLPVLALLAGLAGVRFLHSFNKQPLVGVGLLALAMVSPMAMGAGFFYNWSAERVTRSVFTANPFVEAVDIAKFIRANSQPEDRIAVLGSEPQIYFLSQRRSATGHLYMYGLMEPHPFALAMQKELAAEVERARPRFVVLSESPVSWRAEEKSERWVLGWIRDFIGQRYELAGIARQDQQGKVTMDWAKPGEALAMSPHTLLVFRRKE